MFIIISNCLIYVQINCSGGIFQVYALNFTRENLSVLTITFPIRGDSVSSEIRPLHIFLSHLCVYHVATADVFI